MKKLNSKQLTFLFLITVLVMGVYLFFRPSVDLKYWGGGFWFLLFLTTESWLACFAAFVMYLREISLGVTTRKKSFFEIDNFWGLLYGASLIVPVVLTLITALALYLLKT